MLAELSARARIGLDTFGFFCGQLRTQQGKTLEPEEFQRELLTPSFAGVPVSVVELPKKNGKSTIVAALALFHLLTRDLADVIVVASSVRQAEILYGHCRKLAATSPALREAVVVKAGFKEIRLRENPLCRLRVLTNEPGTLEGVEPTLGIIDEYHVFPTAEPYAIMRDGIGTRNGHLLVITNAGQDELSPLGMLRAEALVLPKGERRGKYTLAVADDLSFAYQEYALEQGDDYTDMRVVKAANPGSWMTEEMLAERFADPGETLQRFQRFACGLWVRSEDTAILPEEWDVLRQPDIEIPAGASVWIGWDASTRGPDTTALVPLWWRSPDERVLGAPTIIKPRDDGGLVSDLDVTNAFLAFEKRWSIEYVVYDPSAGALSLAQRLEREQGWRFVEHSQKPAQMARASIRFLEAVREHKIVHDGNPELRQHVLNAVERSVGTDGSWIFGRPSRGARVPIDALTAAVMVHHSAQAQLTRPYKGVSPIFM